MKGIVSFDMDMTLLNHADYKIPDSAIKALDLLRKNYYIVIATGRDMDAKFSEGLADEVKPDAQDWFMPALSRSDQVPVLPWISDRRCSSGGIHLHPGQRSCRC